MKLYENPALQSEPLWLKQLPLSLFGHGWFVERRSHCSYLIEQHWGLNCDNDGSLAPYTKLTRLYFSSIPYRVHAIHIQCCWYLRYWIFGNPILKQLSFLHLLSICFENSQSDWKHIAKMLWAALWNSCAQFWNYSPPKVVPFFLDHPIYAHSQCLLSKSSHGLLHKPCSKRKWMS